VIVSVHVPKTAGLSVLAFLEASLGPCGVRRDYRGGPAIEGGLGSAGALVQTVVDGVDRVRVRRARPSVRAVHGHFRASKYADLDVDLVAWVRDPVERVASHYGHFRRFHERNRNGRAVRAGLGLVDFAARPGMRNLQSRYLDVPLERFACVGSTSRFDEALARMAERLGLPVRDPAMENRNPERISDHWAIPPEDRARIRELNSRDVDLLDRVDEVFGP